ncbi:unnamed protein product, partial [Microthlaspi erraticum]
ISSCNDLRDCKALSSEKLVKQLGLIKDAR